MLVSPYLSPDSRAICRDHDVAYLDLEGNARLVFDGVYIERSVPTRPKPETRELPMSAGRGEDAMRSNVLAGAVAMQLLDANPNHPGAAHYTIHAFDDPIHAPLALPAARRLRAG